MKDREQDTIHHTQLPPAQPGDALAVEWDTYRREVAGLLAAGHEGKVALIKGSALIGLYPTWESAYEAGLDKYLGQGFLVQPVRSREPVLQTAYSLMPCRD
jgi:hypothetical protein